MARAEAEAQLRAGGEGGAGAGGGAGAAAAAEAVDWAEGAGLEVPRALGDQNSQSDANALPPAVTVAAAEAQGAALCAWPASWHCAPLPAHCTVACAGDARVRVFAEVAQTSVKGVAAGSEPRAFAVHIFEAEVVVTGLEGATSCAELADTQICFA